MDRNHEIIIIGPEMTLTAIEGDREARKEECREEPTTPRHGGFFPRMHTDDTNDKLNSGVIDFVGNLLVFKSNILITQKNPSSRTVPLN